MSYDNKCYDLAFGFLEDKYGANVPMINCDALAQRIQDEIDDYLQELEDAEKEVL